MTDKNGEVPLRRPAFRRTDRTDAPYYLARYAERRGLKQAGSVREPRRGGRERPAPVPAPVPRARRARARRSRPARGGRRALHQRVRRHVPGQGDRRAAGAQDAGGLRHRDPDHQARDHPGLLHRRRPDPDGRLAVAPARAQPVQERPARPEGADRLRRHQPGPADRRPDLPRHERRAAAVGAGGRHRRARADPRAAQLPGLDAGRAARRHLGVPPVPGADGEAGADGGRRPAALAGGDRPVLPHPARRRGPDLHVADHPADVLRAAAVLRAPVLARVPPADGRVAGHPDHRGHPFRADPGVRHLGARLRSWRAVQHRGSGGADPPRRRDRAGGLPQPGHRGERAAARRDAVWD